MKAQIGVFLLWYTVLYARCMEIIQSSCAYVKPQGSVIRFEA